jgi:uncharacterized membrane protein YebE (DUF533 family)
MIDADKILLALRDEGAALAARLQTDPAARATAVAAGGGLLAGLALGSASRFAGLVGRAGVVAALSGLAFHAWTRHQARSRGAQEASQDEAHALDLAPTGFLAAPGLPEDAPARLTLRAMINAAKADGRIDSEERARLFDRLGAVSLSQEEQDFLFAELAGPMDTDGLVQEAQLSPGLAAHVYAASLLAINPDLPSEKAYLAELAERLQLAPELAADLRACAA